MAHQNQGTPADALRNWVARYEMEVLQAGLDEIQSALAIHPDPPAGPPGTPPPRRRTANTSNRATPARNTTPNRGITTGAVAASP